ncbi:class I SAM-dependent methyltransferase [Accumulibacter sp.]|uniref:class I SAM-dependent methyltransferase n=1 Tax=Accumulibacter sp. TaxID=2053492 RepID=UPI0025CE13CD|nr:class I SAM-dependent methyltransferase [Accumulibacter sp.]MCM8596832.1 class I SAM-dependent methyltransferase [Accumulibacter sp.]MCM8624634.1 class I SAM-dependent methyltransferase [Accumulibacter sp.]MDS4050980.1 class I SAM-dependent methyltransferase [Accumulibacter sp.]
MSIPGLDSWLHSALGRYVMDWEQTTIDSVVADLFGYNAVQLGMPERDLLAHNRIPLRQVASPSGHADVLCDLRRLPFAAQSIDLVVMSHVLEFHEDPHQILREVERVLIPEGALVVAGFNPVSFWGLRRRLPGCPSGFPWNGRYLSVARLKDWLQLLGFEVEKGIFGCYSPPCSHERWLSRWRVVESAGARWWSFAGGVYLLQATKRVHGMRLIVPAWKQQKVPSKVLSAVSKKQGDPHEQ